MRDQDDTRRRFTLPLPRFVLQPITALVVALVHVYLAAGHLLDLFGGAVTWTHIWKGFGALAGAYVFLAIASRGRARDQTTDFERGGAGPVSPATHRAAGPRHNAAARVLAGDSAPSFAPRRP